MSRSDGGPQTPATIESMSTRVAVADEMRDRILGTPPGAIPDGLEDLVARCHERLTAARFVPGAEASPEGPAPEVAAKRARAMACVTASPAVAAILAEAERDGFLTVVDGQPAEDEVRHLRAMQCAAAGRPFVEVFIQEDDLAGVMFFTEIASLLDEDEDEDSGAGEPTPEVLAAFEGHPGCRPTTWVNGVDAINLPYEVAVAIARRLVAPGGTGTGGEQTDNDTRD